MSEPPVYMSQRLNDGSTSCDLELRRICAEETLRSWQDFYQTCCLENPSADPEDSEFLEICNIKWLHLLGRARRQQTATSAEAGEDTGPVFSEGGLPNTVRANKALDTVTGLPPSQLWQKIKDRNLLREFERRAREIAIAGGMAVQGFYRNAGSLSNWTEDDPHMNKLLEECGKAGKNPPSKADLVATATILREADSLLAPKVHELGCGLSLLCEETAREPFRRWIEEVLSDSTTSKVHKPDDFFANCYNMVRVIADALDGTQNFRREIAFYCSAVAILIDDQPRVSAIYEPTKSVIYTAVLPGPRTNAAQGATATLWEIVGGNWRDLTKCMQTSPDNTLEHEAVAIHLTRSNIEKRRELVAKLDAIAEAYSGIYALNAGLPAMASVATGGLGAFINNYTNPWDIAAGEVLVRACGGVVTQLDGSEISYNSKERTSVLAAKNKYIHENLLSLINK